MPPIEIPNRSLFKGTEVCRIAGVQPYVLRTWEAEFPDLGVARGDAGARVYRRSDLERVLQIRDLLFVEGLTLAGARRRLGEETRTPDPGTPPIEELLGRDARERLLQVRQGLRDVLHLLSRRAAGVDVGVATRAGGSARRRDGRPGQRAAKRTGRKSGKMARRARH